MNYTNNYKLNLPEGRDVVDIAKLNENFTKLDSQLKSTDSRLTSVNSTLTSSINNVNSTLSSSISATDSQRKPVVGSYTGDGSSSRHINLGFQASLLILSTTRGVEEYRSAMALSGRSCSNAYGTFLSIDSTGFNVSYDTSRYTNISGTTYMYAAWR